MKPKKTSDLRALSDGELRNQISEDERSLVDQRFKQAVGQLESPAVMRTIRRDIARAKTILRERALEIKRG